MLNCLIANIVRSGRNSWTKWHAPVIFSHQWKLLIVVILGRVRAILARKILDLKSSFDLWPHTFLLHRGRIITGNSDRKKIVYFPINSFSRHVFDYSSPDVLHLAILTALTFMTMLILTTWNDYEKVKRLFPLQNLWENELLFISFHLRPF